eukprot:4950840-Pyramimonas_sp.AAC.1
MDFPLYHDYHAQVTGNPRVGTQPENPYARATADVFHQSQLTRGSGCTSGPRPGSAMIHRGVAPEDSGHSRGAAGQPLKTVGPPTSQS